MNANIFLYLLVFLFSVSEFPKIRAKPKTLKIIIPSKIRYVHHHHTHVLVMKDKKPYRGPDAKYHHLHFYDPNGRKGKASNHYFIPLAPPQTEDEVEDESTANFAITSPRRGPYQKSNSYIAAKQQPPVYEEPDYYPSSKKYRIYSRTDFPKTEYYEATPYFSFNREDDEKTNEGEPIQLDRAYNKRNLGFYEADPLFYPEKTFYTNNKKPTYLY